jgi:hypothetical protein
MLQQKPMNSALPREAAVWTSINLNAHEIRLKEITSKSKQVQESIPEYTAEAKNFFRPRDLSTLLDNNTSNPFQASQFAL